MWNLRRDYGYMQASASSQLIALYVLAIEEYQLFTQELEASPGWVVNKDRQRENVDSGTMEEAVKVWGEGTKKGFIREKCRDQVIHGLKAVAAAVSSVAADTQPKMSSADVARSHGGDGGGEDRPPPHHVSTGCGGCFINRGKGTRKPNLGGRGAGRMNTRDKTRNLSLKEVAEAKGPVSIQFDVGDKQTLNPLGPHAAHWSNYIGEVVRSVPLYYPSWEKVSKEQKAAIILDIGVSRTWIPPAGQRSTKASTSLAKSTQNQQASVQGQSLEGKPHHRTTKTCTSRSKSAKPAKEACHIFRLGIPVAGSLLRDEMRQPQTLRSNPPSLTPSVNTHCFGIVARTDSEEGHQLSKKPKKATADLHKDILGTRNPGLGYMAKRAQPALYDADTLLRPTHHPVSIWDSEEVLVHQVVSMKKMNEKPGHVRPANGFYEKLNALMFVPQQELSREQAYWLPANERASQTSNPNRPVTPFTHKSRPPSQVLASLRKVNAVFPQFEGIIKERTTQKPDYVSEWCFDYANSSVEPQLASNAILKLQVKITDQWKDDTIRNLETQINIMKVLNVGSTEGSCDQQALETDRIQLKDTITSLRIQLDGLKVENVSLKRRYDELSKANTHSRTAYTEKLSAFTAENTKLKAQVTGTTSSGPSTSETPKVLAPGMYNLGVKPTSGASKTVPKRAPRNHSSLPVKSANARRVEAHHRTLNKKNRVDSNLLVKHSVSVSKLNNVCAACNKSLVIANHTDCLVMCDGSVNVKPHQTKRFKRQPKKEWKPIKRVWKPISKPVANSKP
ncbi:hypothetical protein Tco_0725675 [Tanacetum coccineum]|uniref:Uncharacterized protein n=1 Tax=Tanacetum coccineum TaxID=301880 RepID=A0ABQ4YDL6_9ASTR